MKFSALKRIFSEFVSEIIITFFILSVFGLMACTTTNSAAKENESNSQITEKTNVVETELFEAIEREVPKYIQANGSFAADQTTQITPVVAGKVESVVVKEGDFIQEGSVIIRLSATDAKLRLEQAFAAENQIQSQIRQAEASLRQLQSQIGSDKNGKVIVPNVPAVLEARAVLLSAESDLKLAQTNEKRYANLLETGDTSRLVYDQRRNELEKAEAAVNEARQNLVNAENQARGGQGAIEAALANVENFRAALRNAEAETRLAGKTVDDTTIRSPLSGFISELPTSKGEYISPNASVMTIVRTNPIKLRLNIPEIQAGQISEGMAISANVSAYAGRNFSGRIRAINPNLNETTRSLLVEAVFENSENLLRPGMFASAKILQSGGEKGIYLPQSALIKNQSTNSVSVYVVENETARLRVIEIDENTPEESEEVRILSGVSAGEKIASQNIEKLFDGVQVTVRN